MNSKMKIDVSGFKNFLCGIPVFIFLWILTGFNTYNGDYSMYQQRYISDIRNPLEVGFLGSMRIIRRLGVDEYQGYLQIVCFAVLSVVFYYACKYTKKSFVVLLLFGFYPYIVLNELVRFAISFAIMLIALFVLMESKRHALIKYVGLVFLASTFHITCLFYLIMLFYRVEKLSRKSKIKIIVAFTIIIAILTYTPFLRITVNFITLGSGKYDLWFQKHARLGMLSPISQQLLSFLILYYAFGIQKHIGTATKIDGNKLLDLNIVAILILPLYFINGNFDRLYYVFIFINMLYIFEVIYQDSWKKVRITKLSILNWFHIFYFFVLNIAWRPDIWKVHFDYNIVFDKLGWFG